MIHVDRLEELPDELLLEIFKHTDPAGMRSIRQSNRRFCSLMEDRDLKPFWMSSAALNMVKGQYTRSHTTFSFPNLHVSSVQIRCLQCTLENRNIKVHRGDKVFFTITSFVNPVALHLAHDGDKPFLYVNDQRRHVYCLDFNGEHQKAHWQDYYYSYKIPRIARIMFILLRTLSAEVKNGIASIISNSVHFFRSLRFYDVLTGLIVLFGIPAITSLIEFVVAFLETVLFVSVTTAFSVGLSFALMSATMVVTLVIIFAMCLGSAIVAFSIAQRVNDAMRQCFDSLGFSRNAS